MLCSALAHVKGLVPLLMHNGRLANPLDQYSKELKKITSKRNKTDADFEAMARIEFLGGMYTNAKGEPCIPDVVIEGFFANAGKSTKKGKDCQAGITVNGEWPLIYDGPKNPEKMWASGKFHDIRACKIGKNKVMRCRPIFRKWELEFEVMYDKGILDFANIKDILGVGTTRAGFCDYIPKFGRFAVTSLKDLGEVKIA